MQLGPTAAATTAPAFSRDSLMPKEMLTARIGKGTVQSEIDRSIRVRLEGSGAPSERKLVPDSKAAVELLASEHGPTFEQAMRSFLAVADPHVGKENLKTITFLPDEHASKGVSVLNWASSAAAAGHDAEEVIAPQPDEVERVLKANPGASKEQVVEAIRTGRAKMVVGKVTEGEAENVSFAGAWNSGGNIVMMPDVSREMLATLDLYRIQPGDQLQGKPVDKRADHARWSWHAALHEAHHSVTPMGARGPEWTSVMEEAVPEVLTPQSIEPTTKAANADPSLAARPARDTKGEAIDWPAWNRDHLPKPDKDSASTAKGRYTDGPKLVKELLDMAGVDRRTTEGKATALELLQGQTASRVPKRLADAIVDHAGLEASAAEPLADRIRQAAIGKATIGEIERWIAEQQG